jgi:hypothetical protein
MPVAEKPCSLGWRIGSAASIAVLSVLAIGTAIVATAGCGKASSSSNPADVMSACLPASATTDTPPANYVITSRVFETMCVVPPAPAGTQPPMVGNYSTYDYLTDKPMGAQLDICTKQTVPTGWIPQTAQASWRCLDVNRLTFETSTTITCMTGCYQQPAPQDKGRGPTQ